MRIERRYTKAGQSPYAAIEFRTATSEIRNPDGSVVFRLDDIEVPAQSGARSPPTSWRRSISARPACPARLKKVEENDVPSWLWRSVADEAALAELPEDERYGSRDRRPPGLRPPRRHLDLLGLEGRLFRHRGGRAAPSTTSCATCWRPRWCAPNSPQWFNTGLHWAYGIDGPGQGHYLRRPPAPAS